MGGAMVAGFDVALIDRKRALQRAGGDYALAWVGWATREYARWAILVGAQIRLARNCGGQKYAAVVALQFGIEKGFGHERLLRNTSTKFRQIVGHAQL